MAEFFSDKVLLSGETAEILYNEVKDLPIIDYHCHLDQRKIASDAKFEDIGQMWLSGDHYKHRAMRLCGVDEKYITGDSTWKEKYLKYAEIMPKLCGNPLYYWTHLELKLVFGITDPLNSGTAEDIYARANAQIPELSVRKILKRFNVELINTTDDPADSLEQHGTYDGIEVRPTFRPDKLYTLDEGYLKKLGASAGINIRTLDDLETAVRSRLDFFVSKGCCISDHGFSDFPARIADRKEAAALFFDRENLTAKEKDAFFGYLLVFLMKEYKKRGIAAQMHFSVIRNVNSGIFKTLGPDAGCDVIGEEPKLAAVLQFLDSIPEAERPPIILYTLNPNAISSLACLSGAFRNVYVGAAWWFNDTLDGIRRNLNLMSEYSCLGTHLGMLTDSRAFLSYSRFDFFRRILASFLAEKVDKGEYPLEDAKKLAADISYGNIRKFLNR